MSVFGVILIRITPYLSVFRIRMRENADQNNSEYGQFYLIILPHKFRAVNRNFLNKLKSICYIAQKILQIGSQEEGTRLCRSLSHTDILWPND